MPSSANWINAAGLAGTETIHNTHIGMTPQDVNSMVDIMMTPPLEHILFGDYSKWTSSLMYYPYDLKRDNAQRNLNIGGTKTSATCFNIDIQEVWGYTLGEYHYTPIYNNYLDYEPYTTLKIYLPYYGFADLPVADVMNKYIQFRLQVDFGTGQAMYTIGVSDEHIESPNAPLKYGTDDSNTRILTNLVFQLGVSVPLGQTGMSDFIRNTISASVKLGGTLAMSAMPSMGTSTTKSHQKVNPMTVTKSSRVGSKWKAQTRTETGVQETERTSVTTHTGQRASSAINQSSDAIAYAHSSANTDKPNNTFVNGYGSLSIKIVRTTAKVLDADETYGHLYGYPLGRVCRLDELSGYTEISAIHLEGDDFASATETEMSLLEDAITSGVIL